MSTIIRVVELVAGHEPTEGDLRVSYIPQLPMQPFQVIIATDEWDDRLNNVGPRTNLQLAAEILDTIVNFSIFEFENKVKPDYSDLAVIERFEDGAWEEIDEDDWKEFIE